MILDKIQTMMIDDLHDHFESPLKTAGVKCSAADMVSQLQELAGYPVETVGITGKDYMKTGRHIFSALF